LVPTEEVIAREVRVVRKQVDPPSQSKHHRSGSQHNTEIREEKIDRRSRKTSRRDQVVPTDAARMNLVKNEKRRIKSNKKSLKVDTSPTSIEGSKNMTSSSTPGSTGLRSNGDLRSPGQRKSPVFQQGAEQPLVPDFITQTDRYGNASTPRNNDALNKARGAVKSSPTDQTTGDDDDDDQSHVEACAETFLDSLRMVCCCLAPEEASEKSKTVAVTAKQQIVADQKENVPRLLPPIHPDDTGKKCLVLDLDETLVHSSFRAVPGADFIIPVQVRSSFWKCPLVWNMCDSF